ncbi:biotin-protein ligase [Corynascus novoguineensis]|uniref:Biotin-protein ligase n=1 Tax=Corynascus novoguineensis TaxID=1126955 RepID=A0AAN7CTG6_9PEZI|nr:biotin-protein ligase [Corynascus novoguineensis]
MASQKLNVLVYTGTGSTLESVRHCIYSLRRLLGPNYAVNPITESALLKEPWAPTCALLVFPGGADLGYCRVLNGAGNRTIAQFVRRGGAYLGFCAGGYYGCRRCEFEVGDPVLEVVGGRELGFFPGTCRGGAFKGFEYHSERGARAASISVAKDAFSDPTSLPSEFRCYYNGGGVFVDADKLATDSGTVQVLAEYTEDLAVESGVAKPAIVYCKFGEGAALLTGPHPEFDAVNLSQQVDAPGYDQLIEALKDDEDARTSFLKACLTKLGLEVSQGASLVPSLSKIHLSALDHSEVGEILCSFDDVITREGGEEYIKGGNDLFHLEKPDSRWSLASLSEALLSDFTKSKTKTGRTSPDPTTDYSHVPKRIVSHEDAWPEPKETPYFNHSVFYSSLRQFQEWEAEAETWGNILMNHNLLSKLPTGSTLAATTQVAGRGRGSNVWVAPPGSLIMSTVINHPAHYAATRPIVFIQYLAALAIVEAVKSYDDGYADFPIKIKWPNDVYVRDPSKPNQISYVKIAGILANCAYSSGSYQVVLGIGINTNNARPTTSLDAVLPLLESSKKLETFRIERLLARILTRLEALYSEFCRNGFSRELEGKYYQHWLHTNQIVTLEAEGGVKARVVGITRDWGMLMAEEVTDNGINGALRSTGKVWALQSDENSFDFWKGLVKRKI